jgi:hypothetical protein
MSIQEDSMTHRAFPFLLATLLTLFTGPAIRPAHALFHLAVIDEVMTSYSGNPSSQFVEIRMLSGSQNLVGNSVLGAFDAAGAYIGDVLVVPGNVANHGLGVRWIMGTAQFQTDSGLTADFIMPPGIIATGGGMVCWGAPGIVPPGPGTWDHTIATNYVDCLAYGTYAGPGNPLIGAPTPLDADGHSLQRTTNTSNNLADFTCADPATPEDNNGVSANMTATTVCPGATTTTTVSSTTTTTLVPPVPTASPQGLLLMAALLALCMSWLMWTLHRRAHSTD